jgi:threonine synthase
VKDAPLPLPGGGDPLVVHVAELWHGPTLAFKDLGMQVLARVSYHPQNIAIASHLVAWP